MMETSHQNNSSFNPVCDWLQRCWQSHEHLFMLSLPPHLHPFSMLNEAWIVFVFQRNCWIILPIFYTWEYMKFWEEQSKAVFSKIKICQKKDVMQKIHIFLSTNIKLLPKEIISKWFFSCISVLFLRKFI